MTTKKDTQLTQQWVNIAKKLGRTPDQDALPSLADFSLAELIQLQTAVTAQIGKAMERFS